MRTRIQTPGGIAGEFDGMDFNNQRTLLLFVYDNLNGRGGCLSCFYSERECPICGYLIDNIGGRTGEQKGGKILQLVRSQPPGKKISLGGLFN